MVYDGALCKYAVEHHGSSGICPIMYSSGAQHNHVIPQHTVMSLPAATIMELHRTLSLSVTTIMMLHCTLSDRLYHYHGTPSYAIRHPLSISGCSTVHYSYLRPLYDIHCVHVLHPMDYQLLFNCDINWLSKIISMLRMCHLGQ